MQTANTASPCSTKEASEPGNGGLGASDGAPVFGTSPGQAMPQPLRGTGEQSTPLTAHRSMSASSALLPAPPIEFGEGEKSPRAGQHLRTQCERHATSILVGESSARNSSTPLSGQLTPLFEGGAVEGGAEVEMHFGGSGSCTPDPVPLAGLIDFGDFSMSGNTAGPTSAAGEPQSHVRTMSTLSRPIVPPCSDIFLVPASAPPVSRQVAPVQPPALPVSLGLVEATERPSSGTCPPPAATLGLAVHVGAGVRCKSGRGSDDVRCARDVVDISHRPHEKAGAQPVQCVVHTASPDGEHTSGAFNSIRSRTPSPPLLPDRLGLCAVVRGRSPIERKPHAQRRPEDADDELSAAVGDAYEGAVSRCPSRHESGSSQRPGASVMSIAPTPSASPFCSTSPAASPPEASASTGRVPVLLTQRPYSASFISTSPHSSDRSITASRMHSTSSITFKVNSLSPPTSVWSAEPLSASRGAAGQGRSTPVSRGGHCQRGGPGTYATRLGRHGANSSCEICTYGSGGAAKGAGRSGNGGGSRCGGSTASEGDSHSLTRRCRRNGKGGHDYGGFINDTTLASYSDPHTPRFLDFAESFLRSFSFLNTPPGVDPHRTDDSNEVSATRAAAERAAAAAAAAFAEGGHELSWGVGGAVPETSPGPVGGPCGDSFAGGVEDVECAPPSAAVVSRERPFIVPRAHVGGPLIVEGAVSGARRSVTGQDSKEVIALSQALRRQKARTQSLEVQLATATRELRDLRLATKSALAKTQDEPDAIDKVTEAHTSGVDPDGASSGVTIRCGPHHPASSHSRPPWRNPMDKSSPSHKASTAASAAHNWQSSNASGPATCTRAAAPGPTDPMVRGMAVPSGAQGACAERGPAHSSLPSASGGAYTWAVAGQTSGAAVGAATVVPTTWPRAQGDDGLPPTPSSLVPSRLSRPPTPPAGASGGSGASAGVLPSSEHAKGMAELVVAAAELRAAQDSVAQQAAAIGQMARAAKVLSRRTSRGLLIDEAVDDDEGSSDGRAAEVGTDAGGPQHALRLQVASAPALSETTSATGEPQAAAAVAALARAAAAATAKAAAEEDRKCALRWGSVAAHRWLLLCAKRDLARALDGERAALEQAVKSAQAVEQHKRVAQDERWRRHCISRREAAQRWLLFSTRAQLARALHKERAAAEQAASTAETTCVTADELKLESAALARVKGEEAAAAAVAATELSSVRAELSSVRAELAFATAQLVQARDIADEAREEAANAREDAVMTSRRLSALAVDLHTAELEAERSGALLGEQDEELKAANAKLAGAKEALHAVAAELATVRAELDGARKLAAEVSRAHEEEGRRRRVAEAETQRIRHIAQAAVSAEASAVAAVVAAEVRADAAAEEAAAAKEAEARACAHLERAQESRRKSAEKTAARAAAHPTHMSTGEGRVDIETQLARMRAQLKAEHTTIGMLRRDLATLRSSSEREARTAQAKLEREAVARRRAEASAAGARREAEMAAKEARVARADAAAVRAQVAEAAKGSTRSSGGAAAPAWLEVQQPVDEDSPSHHVRSAEIAESLRASPSRVEVPMAVAAPSIPDPNMAAAARAAAQWMAAAGAVASAATKGNDKTVHNLDLLSEEELPSLATFVLSEPARHAAEDQRFHRSRPAQARQRPSAVWEDDEEVETLQDALAGGEPHSVESSAGSGDLQVQRGAIVAVHAERKMLRSCSSPPATKHEPTPDHLLQPDGDASRPYQLPLGHLPLEPTPDSFVR